MVERIKSRKGVGQKPKYMLFLEALNRIYRTLQSDSVTVIKIVINADYLGFFLISHNGSGLNAATCRNLILTTAVIWVAF